jgi:hypothetical protein
MKDRFRDRNFRSDDGSVMSKRLRTSRKQLYQVGPPCSEETSVSEWLEAKRIRDCSDGPPIAIGIH